LLKFVVEFNSRIILEAIGILAGRRDSTEKDIIVWVRRDFRALCLVSMCNSRKEIGIDRLEILLAERAVCHLMVSNNVGILIHIQIPFFLPIVLFFFIFFLSVVQKVKAFYNLCLLSSWNKLLRRSLRRWTLHRILLTLFQLIMLEEFVK